MSAQLSHQDADLVRLSLQNSMERRKLSHYDGNQNVHTLLGSGGDFEQGKDHEKKVIVEIQKDAQGIFDQPQGSTTNPVNDQKVKTHHDLTMALSEQHHAKQNQLQSSLEQALKAQDDKMGQSQSPNQQPLSAMEKNSSSAITTSQNNTSSINKSS